LEISEKHPLTSDAIGSVEREVEQAGTDAVEGFIERMGGYTQTHRRLVRRCRKVATGAIERAEDLRTKRVAPLYEKAAQEATAGLTFLARLRSA